MRRKVAVLLYPGCIFFEVALATELLAKSFDVLFFTPDGMQHLASNGSVLQAFGSYADLESLEVACVLIPGGDPGSIIPQNTATQCLQAASARGSVMAGICAGNLVLASAGLLRGVRATHNYTLEHATPEAVQATESFWEGIVFERADTVVDGRFITAQPWACVKFAAAVARSLDAVKCP
ncbi:DJ-1/PfpI family protein [Rhodoferax sp. AJA081-3]|uniref:DJ-1/PfpI family protein n=1 Tax=Rhodoferax sp. AJA081-3 TaxID=2752316 RepID=UPI001ADF15FD|nr:DJ-1/PfpI family protein [Rhodoferax sp. AJA081-3]QTN27937.1 DJ-1/PfpI family protein [Rhodoferax sp. AJA081-3]